MIVITVAFFGALLLAWALIPLLSNFAQHVGLVDHPDKHRKLHKNAIPMVGGLALFIATPIVASLVLYTAIAFPSFWHSIAEAIVPSWAVNYLAPTAAFSSRDLFELVGLFLGSAVLLAVGLADDRFNIRGRQKLLGQIVAITVLIIFGYQFDHIYFLSNRIDFGVFSGLVIYAWVLAAINSVNLLDGADGIAATIGLIMSAASCVMALLLNQIEDAIVSAAIAGALLAFLRFNFPPAKAYLGDSGSMLIGFLLSALAIRCMFKQTSAYAFFAPVALLAIPFIDTAAAIVRRRLTGRSIFSVDRGHLHHALMERGGPRVSLLWVALLCSTTAAGGVLSMAYHQSEYALVSIAIVLAVMVGFNIFGIAELRLVSRRANSLTRSLLKYSSTGGSPTESLGDVHVQGDRNWKHVWKQLCDFSNDHSLHQLTLDINAPWLHESYHGTRSQRGIARGESSEWFMVIPLVADNRAFGRVEIYGSHAKGLGHHEVLRNLLKITEDVELSMTEPTPDLQESSENAGTAAVATLGKVGPPR